MEQSQQQPSTVQFAMNYGAVLGLYYIGKFMLFPLSFKSPLAGLLFVVLTLAVPVLAYKLTKRFRYSFTSDGVITFSKAWSFALQLFLYASVIVAAAHYIYFTFFDHGTIAAAFNDSLAQMQTTTIEGVTDTASWQAQLDSMKETFKTIASMTPAQLTMQLLGNNLFWGCIAALPVAVLNAHRPALMK
ncbi:MAG: DUF4199 domain-containing protein [Bacteroidaceae bacterium]|nr:DUF4199 domain-containing protein [Bacteroidaceae bacterium]